MDEVDRIIIRTLKNLDCDIEEDVTTLSDFSTELVIQGAVTCLKTINSSLKLSPKLPPNLSARFKLGAAIAQTCVDLGYKGDIGYQTFLYSNELELRKLFIFLIEKLPKEPEQIAETTQSSFQRKIQEIRLAIAREISLPWLPQYACVSGLYWSGDTFSRQSYPCGSEFVAESVRWPDRTTGPAITNQVKHPFHLVPSLLELDTLHLLCHQRGKSVVTADVSASVPHITSRFGVLNQIQGHTQPYKTSKRFKPALPAKPNVRSTQGENEPVIHVNPTEKETNDLKADIENLKLKYEELLQSQSQVENRLSEVISKMTKEEAFLKEKATTTEKEEKIYGLLHDGLAHVARLTNHVEKMRQKFSSLPVQWDEVRVPLEDRLRELNENRGSQRKDQLQLEEMKNKFAHLMNETSAKEAIRAKLEHDCQSLNEEVSRLFYTRRIMEIIQNVQKQNEEIYRVLNDLCVLQREINQSVGKLDRTFTVADELLFQGAKRDVWSKKAYKLLVQLHAHFEEITNAVEESGQLNREVLDLEEQLTCEQNKNLAASLKRITHDLHLIREENSQLIGQLKTLRPS